MCVSARCPSILRQFRQVLQISQAAFAEQLGVPVESYRTWDSGRRTPPDAVVQRARGLAAHPNDVELLPLASLAPLVSVHVRTLQAAARDGRLTVVYDTRTTFRRLRPKATLRSAVDFRQHRYGQRSQCEQRSLRWCDVPEDYDTRIVAIRRRLKVSQREFALLVGAAQKAVVYQWESRKRCPSPIFWQRISRL
jgi:DNA-binding transcriptional regulator YiaG